MTIQVEKIGAWTIQFSDEVVILTEEHVEEMTRFLNEKWLPWVQQDYRTRYGIHNLALTKWGVPSFLIRMDMPCLDDGTPFGVYEVEANPAGYGVDAVIGLPTAPILAQALKDLGITSLGYGVAPSRQDQKEDLEIFANLLIEQGIEVSAVELGKIPRGLPLWLRAGKEDMSSIFHLLEQCLLLHYDGGGHKGYLIPLCGAKLLSGCDPWEEFPEGFALKPISGWGSRGVELWCPENPWRRRGSTVTKINRVIEELKDSGRTSEFLVQPFLRPQLREGRTQTFRIWRIYAVWTSDGYKVIGGIWSQRTHTKVHGANDTVDGVVQPPTSL